MGGLLSLLIFLYGRTVTEFIKIDLLVYVVPYWSWYLLMLTDLKSKGVANLSEAIWLGLVVLPLYVIVRILIKDKINTATVSFAYTALATIAGVVMYFTVPPNHAQ